MNLGDVYKVSDLETLIPAYDGLLVEMSGSRILQPERVPELLGYDIVSAELLPHSLWISTIAGSLTFQFEEIWFSLPD